MLRSLLDTAAALAPEREVMTLAQRRITLSEVCRRSDVLAAVLRERGADACVLLAQNGPVLPITLMACATAGIPVVPLNYRLPDASLGDLLARFDAPLTVADEEQRARIRADFGTGEFLALSDDDPAASTASPDGADLPDADALAAILFTSGTTAAPKAVPLSHANLASYVLNTLDLCAASPEETALVSVPPYHVAGLSSALTNLLSGRRVAYLPSFDARTWLDVVRRERVTTAMVVPTMLARIVDELGEDIPFECDLAQLSYGGAPTSPRVLRKALEAFPETGFTNAYGLTETSSTLALLTPEDHRIAAGSSDPAIRARLGSVGRPVPGVELEVRDSDGRALGTGEEGVLWVRGEQISGRYIGASSALDADGWFCTRDGARIDADGYVFLLGRQDDTIIRGGENVAPAEIEVVLAEHPQVKDVAVVGLPDDEWGQRIVAAVVPAVHELDPAELLSWARPLLRSSRTPDSVVLMDELHYGPTGKLLRTTLQQQLLESPSQLARSTS